MNDLVDQDLLQLIQNSDHTIQSRCRAFEVVLGLSLDKDGIDYLISSENYIPFIVSFIEKNKTENELTCCAYNCLINISREERGANAILNAEKDFCSRVLNSLTNAHFVEAKCYILCNMSSHSFALKEVADCTCSQDILNHLKEQFFSTDVAQRKKYDFLSIVFSNITRVTVCRRLFLEDEIFVNGILFCLKSSEPNVRRLGAALTLRNLFFERDYHQKLLDELNVLPSILLPLMGPEEYEEDEMDKLPPECQYLEDSKQRDSNSDVHRILVQALILFCYTEYGWNMLKSKGVYYVLRELHKCETDSKAVDAIETLVAYLLVETYSSKDEDGRKIIEESSLLEQLETDFSKDLPDFQVKQ